MAVARRARPESDSQSFIIHRNEKRPGAFRGQIFDTAATQRSTIASGVSCRKGFDDIMRTQNDICHGNPDTLNLEDSLTNLDPTRFLLEIKSNKKRTYILFPKNVQRAHVDQDYAHFSPHGVLNVFKYSRIRRRYSCSIVYRC